MLSWLQICIDSESERSKKFFRKHKYKQEIHVDIDALAMLYIRKRKCANDYKRKAILPPAEFRISQNSELYLKLLDDGLVMSSKEEYAKANNGYSCTDDYPSGDPVCQFRDECMASGFDAVKGEDNE